MQRQTGRFTVFTRQKHTHTQVWHFKLGGSTLKCADDARARVGWPPLIYLLSHLKIDPGLLMSCWWHEKLPIVTRHKSKAIMFHFFPPRKHQPCFNKARPQMWWYCCNCLVNNYLLISLHVCWIEDIVIMQCWGELELFINDLLDLSPLLLLRA